MTTVKKHKPSWLVVFGLVASFLIPMALAQYIYMHSKGVGLNAANHGDIVNPLVDTANLQFDTLEGKPLLLSKMHGKWLMMLVENQCPTDDSKKHIYYQRHIRDAMGKDRERVSNLLVVPKNCKLRALATVMKKAYPKMTLAIATEQQMTRLNQQLTLSHAATVHRGEGQVYFVDPTGNLMMHFDVKQNPKYISTDMKHLLKVSKIG
ncbi:MAG: hypothetical protein P1U63_09895 [Coxiellaceae bacterium]|nr:hypothetical protein [Coxiellaceae bacterium]